MRGPASHVSENGQYTDGLIKPAATVSDKLDTNLCPANIKVCICGLFWSSCIFLCIVVYDIGFGTKRNYIKENKNKIESQNVLV